MLEKMMYSTYELYTFENKKNWVFVKQKNEKKKKKKKKKDKNEQKKLSKTHQSEQFELKTMK